MKDVIRNDIIEKVILTNEEIQNRAKELAKKISSDYQGKVLVLIGLLKGAIPFMAELIKHLTIDIIIDFLEVSSYRGTQSTGKVSIKKDISIDISGRDVLLVEDIVDTGLTIKCVYELLENRGANSINVATLLDKPKSRTVDGINPKYIASTIEPMFVVGFGLDYNQLYRNLSYVGVLKRSVYEK